MQSVQPSVSLCICCESLTRKYLPSHFENHCNQTLHGQSMFGVKAKIYGVTYTQSNSIASDETSSYWSAPKSSAFHWLPHVSLVSIGQHFVTMRVVHLLKVPITAELPNRTKADVINESDQAMRAVQHCNS